MYLQIENVFQMNLSWSFPNEIWAQVLSTLEVEDLRRARLVCQRFAHIGIRFLEYNMIYFAPCPYAIEALYRISKQYAICEKAHTLVYDDTLFIDYVNMRRLTRSELMFQANNNFPRQDDNRNRFKSLSNYRQALDAQEGTIDTCRVFNALATLLPFFPNLRCLHIIGTAWSFPSTVATSYRSDCYRSIFRITPWPSCWTREITTDERYRGPWDNRGVEQVFRALTISKTQITAVKFGGFNDRTKVIQAIPLTVAFQNISQKSSVVFFENLTCLSFNIDQSRMDLGEQQFSNGAGISWNWLIRGVGTLLKAAKRLTLLTLGGSQLNSVDWTDVIRFNEAITWPRLASLRLDYLRIEIDHLADLLRRHPGLENLELLDVALAHPASWQELMITIDPRLHLRSVTIERLCQYWLWPRPLPGTFPLPGVDGVPLSTMFLDLNK